MSYKLTPSQYSKIDTVVSDYFNELSLHCVALIDMAGNVIVEYHNNKIRSDIYSLAALAAGNFAAVNEMAKLVGEREFSLFFHKGERESIHFSKIADMMLLISVFGPETSLGFLRLKALEVITSIEQILEGK
ncbi:MAG: roadblock/LC7 domain-containing protein [Desulfatiglandales bacterium]